MNVGWRDLDVVGSVQPLKSTMLHCSLPLHLFLALQTDIVRLWLWQEWGHLNAGSKPVPTPPTPPAAPIHTFIDGITTCGMFLCQPHFHAHCNAPHFNHIICSSRCPCEPLFWRPSDKLRGCQTEFGTRQTSGRQARALYAKNECE